MVGENNGTITNSSATGTVTGQENVGGLVGKNNGTITNSYASGTAEGNSYVGGLVGGNNFGIITNSFATSDATAINNNAGGLAGYSI